MTDFFRISLMTGFLAIVVGLGQTASYGDTVLPTLTLPGTATGSFNGSPFSTITSLQGITFVGSPFTFMTLSGSGFLVLGGPCACEGVGFGTMSWNGSLSGLNDGDVFILRMTFDPAASANPASMDFSFHLRLFSNGIEFLPPPFQNLFGDPLNFNSGIYNVNGDIGVGIQNITTFHPSETLNSAAIHVTNINPPYVPEPATIVLMGTALMGLGLYRRYRK